jgi:CheY-like chemotaxis protein
MYPDDAENVVDLISIADYALYEAKRAGKNRFCKPKILVVNDDAASLLALTSLLEQWAEESNYEVLSARSGPGCAAPGAAHDFAVILLDVNMPGMDGFETAEAIHQRPRSADIPIIFVTAFLADEIDRLKAYQRGAADFLFTPVIPQVLRAKVQVFVALAMKNLELKRQAEKLSQRTTELTATNKRLVREMEERARPSARPAPRTNSWPCWATNCAIRCRPSAAPPR